MTKPEPEPWTPWHLIALFALLFTFIVVMTWILTR